MGCGQMIKKSWFKLELYTPTPGEYTEDYIYKQVDNNYSIINKNENKQYINNCNNYTFINKLEVIHIEY